MTIHQGDTRTEGRAGRISPYYAKRVGGVGQKPQPRAGNKIPLGGTSTPTTSTNNKNEILNIVRKDAPAVAGNDDEGVGQRRALPRRQ